MPTREDLLNLSVDFSQSQGEKYVCVSTLMGSPKRALLVLRQFTPKSEELKVVFNRSLSIETIEEVSESSFEEEKMNINAYTFSAQN